MRGGSVDRYTGFTCSGRAPRPGFTVAASILSHRLPQLRHTHQCIAWLPRILNWSWMCSQSSGSLGHTFCVWLRLICGPKPCRRGRCWRSWRRLGCGAVEEDAVELGAGCTVRASTTIWSRAVMIILTMTRTNLAHAFWHHTDPRCRRSFLCRSSSSLCTSSCTRRCMAGREGEEGRKPREH